MCSALPLLVLCLASLAPVRPAQSQTANFTYQLHRLKSFWTGSGVGVQYSDRLLLSSDKLVHQLGTLSTKNLFDIGTTFSTEMTFDYHITHPDFSTQNVILAFTQNKGPVQLYSEDSDSYLPLPKQFEGFVFYIHNFETAYVGWFKSSNLSKEEVISRGKVCKLGARSLNQLRVRIKYENKVMKIYFDSNRESIARVCGQFTDLDILRHQRLLVSASDDTGQSQVAITNWTLSTNSRYDIVAPDKLQPEKRELAYWASMTGANPSYEIGNFKESALYFYDNSKVYSEELSKLADKNMADLKEGISNDLSIASQSLRRALDVIAKEADQLEALGWVLTESKNRHKFNTINVLDMTVNWLETIDQSFDRTDIQTGIIVSLIKELDLEPTVEKMMNRVEELSTSLKKLNSKAAFLIKEQSLDFLEDESVLGDWADTLREFETDVHRKIKNNKIRANGIADFGVMVLCVVGAVLLGGFIWIYCRLKIAVDKSGLTENLKR